MCVRVRWLIHQTAMRKGSRSEGRRSREAVSQSNIWRGIDKINGGSSFSSNGLLLSKALRAHRKEGLP
jgi:hypothetical protein